MLWKVGLEQDNHKAGPLDKPIWIPHEGELKATSKIIFCLFLRDASASASLKLTKNIFFKSKSIKLNGP